MSPATPEPAEDLPPPLPHRKTGLMARLRNYFLTGLIVAAPIGLTLFVTRWFVEMVDTWFVPFIPEPYRPDSVLPFEIPGVGLIMALVFLTVLGAVTANFLGRAILNFVEGLVSRMPVVSTIYSALKQIFETAISQNNPTFREVALLEYPSKGVYRLAFVTSGKSSAMSGIVGAELTSVFVPFTPNITSGFLVYVPREELKILDITVEQAAKLIVSAGLVEPGEIKPKTV